MPVARIKRALTSRRAGAAGALLALGLLAAAGYGQLLAPGATPYSPHSDLVAQHLGTFEVLGRSLRERGELPRWRSDQLSGVGTAANPQARYTNPLNLPFLLADPAHAAGPALLLRLLLAGLAFYLLGAALGLGRLARLFMAAAGLFSFKLIIAAYAGWLPHLSALVCLPLLFAAVLRFCARPGPLGALALAAAGALSLHAGHLQYLYYAGWFVAAYVALQAAGRWRAAAPGPLRAGAWLTLAAALGLGLSAYLFISVPAELPLLTRGDGSYDFFLSGHALEARHLLTFLRPEALGTPLDGGYPELWEVVGYFGLVPLGLAVVGVAARWRAPEIRFFAACLCITIALAFDSPLLRLAHAHLPGLSLFRCPGRLLSLTSIFGIGLAGVGLDWALDRLGARRRPLALALGGALTLIVALEGIYYARRYLWCEPAQRVLPGTGYQRHLAAAPGPFRVAPVYRSTVSYGWAAHLGLELVTGYDPFNYRHYRTYFQLMTRGAAVPADVAVWHDLTGIRRWDLLDALNARYLIAPTPLRAEGRLQLVARLPQEPIFVFYRGLTRKDLFLYRNPTARARAFWAERTELARDDAEALDRVQRADLTRTAVIVAPRADAEATASRAGAGGGASVAVLDSGDGHLELEVHTPTRRYLVVSEVWHPGWRARLGAGPARLYRTDLALMGLWIPPGKHRLSLTFEPPGRRVGLLISAAAGAVWLLLAGWCLRRRRAAHVARRRSTT